MLAWISIQSADVQAAEAHKPEVQELCPSVTLKGSISPGLSGPERRLVCGDPQSDAWKTIPLSQAKYFLSIFLQERGYLHPKYDFKIEHEEAGHPPHMTVEVGEIIRVTKLTVPGAPDELDTGRKRKVVGEIMTPDLLTHVEQWIVQRLGSIGYPCPKVKALGDPETGEIQVQVIPGPKQNLVSVVEDSIPGIAPGVLRRYDAFRLGDLYNGDLLELSSTRLRREGLFDSSHFTSTCSPDGAIAHQQVIAGPPRLLSFGFGIDTEGLILVRASWKNTRLGRKASLNDVTLLASTKEQRLNASFNGYVFDPGSRQSIRPLFETRHQNEESFETLTIKGQVAHETTWDRGAWGLHFRTGPSLEQVRTYRGDGPRNSHFLSLGFQVDAMTHDFEFYQNSPRQGGALSLATFFSDKDLLSTVTAQRVSLRAEGLYNLRQYDPPLIVFGARGGLDTTTPISDQVPPTFRYFLGGSRDLRGYGRQELPRSGTGGATAGFIDLETRFVTILPYGLEPFVFYDIGAIGENPFSFDSPLYTSPGIGLRWATPFGVIRATGAHGFPLHDDTGADLGHWQFFFSYGEEF